MVFQDVNHQLFSESVSEDVTLGLRLSEDEKRSTAEEMLRRMELWGYREAHPMALSGGQKQRLAIASAVAAGRSVLFLDEPTSGLDHRHMMEVAGLLKALRESGKTVYVITHDPELICECCTDIIHLERGSIRETYPMDAAGADKIRQFFCIDA